MKQNDRGHTPPPPTGIAIMLALFCFAALSLGLAVSGLVVMWIW